MRELGTFKTRMFRTGNLQKWKLRLLQYWSTKRSVHCITIEISFIHNFFKIILQCQLMLPLFIINYKLKLSLLVPKWQVKLTNLYGNILKNDIINWHGKTVFLKRCEFSWFQLVNQYYITTNDVSSFEDSLSQRFPGSFWRFQIPKIPGSKASLF